MILSNMGSICKNWTIHGQIFTTHSITISRKKCLKDSGERTPCWRSVIWNGIEQEESSNCHATRLLYCNIIQRYSFNSFIFGQKNNQGFKFFCSHKCRPCPFIQILSRFYSDFLETHFIQILSRFYPGHRRAYSAAQWGQSLYIRSFLNKPYHPPLNNP